MHCPCSTTPSSPPALRSDVVEDEKALGRRFRVVAITVTLGGRAVELLRPENSDALITEEDYVRDERLPYWADLWPSALILAEHLAARDGRGKSVLELGCGIGLVAFAAAHAGFAVTATDYYDDALAFTSVNVARNGRSPLTVRMIDWRALPDDLGRFDLVVASDVLYEARYPGLIASVLAQTLAPGGTALIADPGRVAAPDFPAECSAHDLEVTGQLRMPFEDGDIRQTIDLISVQWRRHGGAHAPRATR